MEGFTPAGGEPTVDMRDADTMVPDGGRRFPATPSSVGLARRFLLATLPDACDDAADVLVLMLSELATNAVQHAATEFEVAVRVAPDGSRVRVDVSDGAAGYPAPQDQHPDAPHGRGLHIVRTLADAWGIEMHRDRPGKTVWFSVPLPRRERGPRPRRDGRRRSRRRAGRLAAAWQTSRPGPSRVRRCSTRCATPSWRRTSRA